MKSYLSGYQTALSLCIVLGTSSSASAAMIYGLPASLSGSRDASLGQLTTTDHDWSDGTIEWSISFGDVFGTFDYSYVFKNFNKPGISHFTLDITDDAFLAGSLIDPGAITNAKLNGILIDPGSLEFGDKDGIAGSVKFDVGDDGDLTYSFTSNRAPVWGDFYLKGGSSAIATNLSFGDQTDTDPLGYIARPNGTLPQLNSSAPEPSSIMLASFLMLLLLGRVYTSHHKQKQKERAYSQSPLSST